MPHSKALLRMPQDEPRFCERSLTAPCTEMPCTHQPSPPIYRNSQGERIQRGGQTLYCYRWEHYSHSPLCLWSPRLSLVPTEVSSMLKWDPHILLSTHFWFQDFWNLITLSMLLCFNPPNTYPETCLSRPGMTFFSAKDPQGKWQGSVTHKSAMP